MTFVLAGDMPQRNGDMVIATDKGRLVALVYAQPDATKTQEIAYAFVDLLNAAYSPGMTDMMVTPEQLDEWLEQNPPPA